MAVNALDNVVPDDPAFGTPNHLILWLDPHIGNPANNIELKKAFSSAINPQSETWTTTTDRDYGNLLTADVASTITFGDRSSSLIAFTDPDACYAAFQKYRNHHIFFVVSGRLAENFIPRLLPEFQDLFTDPVTQNPYQSIYIFCDPVGDPWEWSLVYCDYVLIFTHEADLLVRMVRDAAEYFLKQAERQPTEHPNEALRFYSWSKKLYLRYERLGERVRQEIVAIDKKMAVVERNKGDVDMADSDEDGEKDSEPCS